jgi:prepilin-type N-terminal cleavage/methylation domain-containing protein
LPRRGFTFIEVMVVVLLLGILAGAAAWYMTEQVQRSSRESAVGQLAYADRMARLRARRLGQEYVLRFDLDQQTVRRYEKRDGVTVRPGHGLNVPVRCRIDRVRTTGLAGEGVPGESAQPGQHASGTVDIVYSRDGRSATYALRLVARDKAVWVVFSGLTGQVTLRDHEDQIDNLFTLLATGRPDAD